VGEEKKEKKKKSFLRGNPSRPDPFLLESSSADTGHRYQISPVDSQLGLTYDPCGSTLNGDNTLERDVDHSSAYCDSWLRHPQSSPFEVILCQLLPNLQSFMGTEVGSPNITRQNIWTKVGPAVIRNFDQCIPRCITITCSESTLMCCPMNSTELFPNFWISINFSLGDIINFDQMCQYRPKSSIWKTPTWREKRSKNHFKQITISNYILLSTFYPHFSWQKQNFIYKWHRLYFHP
jgi:hypothetical protein